MDYFLYLIGRVVVALLQLLPVGLSYRVGLSVGWVSWKLLGKRRKVVRQNLEIVNEWLRAQGRPLDLEIEMQVREVFLRSGANLLAGFSFARMSASRVDSCLELEGIEALRSALSEGKGAIILLAHMGPWEALTQLPSLAKLAGIDAAFGAMYRPLNNRRLDDWMKTQRASRGTTLFSRNDGFHKPVDFIKTGGMLGILADQRMRQGARVPYFGVDVPSSPIPGLFQRRSGAPMLSVAIETVGKAGWRLQIKRLDLAHLSEKPSREEYAAVSNQALESLLSISVLDGFWFHRRFGKERYL
ncbi:MAG: hypothetical protein AAGC73_08355 [Verrucomicrobiota bacterium]